MAAAAAPKPKPKRVQSHPPKKSSGTFFFGHQNENVGRALNVVVVIVGFDLRTEKLRAEVFFFSGSDRDQSLQHQDVFRSDLNRKEVKHLKKNQDGASQGKTNRFLLDLSEG